MASNRLRSEEDDESHPLTPGGAGGPCPAWPSGMDTQGEDQNGAPMTPGDVISGICLDFVFLYTTALVSPSSLRGL